MGLQEVQQFLSHLAVAGHVAASTQSQALSAILFLYQQVLKQDIGWLHDIVRAKQPQRLPVVLTQDEVAKVLRQLSGVTWIMGTLLYGAGLRLLECLRLRVKDLDFSYHQIVVRDGKDQKDRVTMLPQHVKTPLQTHLQDVKQLHARDLDAGRGAVYLPHALERKCPNAHRDWMWQYVFPATQLSRDPRTGIVRRHHTHEQVLQRAVHVAVRQAGISKPPPRATPFVHIPHPLSWLYEGFSRSALKRNFIEPYRIIPGLISPPLPDVMTWLSTLARLQADESGWPLSSPTLAAPLRQARLPLAALGLLAPALALLVS